MECTHKRYLTEASADSMVRWMREDKTVRMKKRNREALATFRCPRCGFWRVGRDGEKLRRRA